jgi:hypothetical protein
MGGKRSSILKHHSVLQFYNILFKTNYACFLQKIHCSTHLMYFINLVEFKFFTMMQKHKLFIKNIEF